MAVVKELIRKEADNSLSFGDYTLKEKTKLSDFEVNGDIYKVKTYYQITKLEKNGMFIYESTPGTAVNAFRASNDEVSFFVEGQGDSQITLELEADTQYEVFIEGNSTGKVCTNLGGKLTIGIEEDNGGVKQIKVVKC